MQNSSSMLCFYFCLNIQVKSQYSEMLYKYTRFRSSEPLGISFTTIQLFSLERLLMDFLDFMSTRKQTCNLHARLQAICFKTLSSHLDTRATIYFRDYFRKYTSPKIKQTPFESLRKGLFDSGSYI